MSGRFDDWLLECACIQANKFKRARNDHKESARLAVLRSQKLAAQGQE